MTGTRIMLMVLAAQSYCLLSHGHDERDKNNTDDGYRCSAQLLIIARA